MALGLLTGALVTVLAAGVAFAQAAGGGGGAAGGGRGGRMMDYIKSQLGATDEEWTVLEPKLQKVMDLNRDLMAGRFGFGGRGRRGGAAETATAPTTDLGEKIKALSDTLDNKDADPKDIKQKLDAVRDARERVRSELVKAQADLKDHLSVSQEARLVLMGVLE
jgi:hypothetical protein